MLETIWQPFNFLLPFSRTQQTILVAFLHNRSLTSNQICSTFYCRNHLSNHRNTVCICFIFKEPQVESKTKSCRQLLRLFCHESIDLNKISVSVNRIPHFQLVTFTFNLHQLDWANINHAGNKWLVCSLLLMMISKIRTAKSTGSSCCRHSSTPQGKCYF